MHGGWLALCHSLTGGLRKHQPLTFMSKLFIDKIGLQDDDDDNRQDNDPQLEALRLTLKDHLRRYYKPVSDPAEAEYHHTTQEIYDQLFRILPNALVFSASDVASWLTEFGFQFFDYGEMRLEWMMKKA